MNAFNLETRLRKETLPIRYFASPIPDEESIMRNSLGIPFTTQKKQNHRR